MINIVLKDCMEAMAEMKDKAYDLAIVDPPYGIGNRLSDGGGKLKNTPMAVLYRESAQWDTCPDDKFFKELFRVSKNQVICGGNYFDLPPTRGFICWDKKQHMPTLSKCEYFWTSFDKPANMFRYVSTDLNRFHPTQKPVKLYEWLLKNYAKPGDKILDTHGGSCSIAIACYNLDFDLDCFEIDAEYHGKAVKRLEEHRKQGRLFSAVGCSPAEI